MGAVIHPDALSPSQDFSGAESANTIGKPRRAKRLVVTRREISFVNQFAVALSLSGHLGGAIEAARPALAPGRRAEP